MWKLRVVLNMVHKKVRRRHQRCLLLWLHNNISHRRVRNLISASGEKVAPDGVDEKVEEDIGVVNDVSMEENPHQVQSGTKKEVEQESNDKKEPVHNGENWMEEDAVLESTEELADEFEDLTDEEHKDGVEKEDGAAGEKEDLELSNVVKKGAPRRQLFLPGVGGNSEKKFAQVLLSPRKRAAAAKQNQRRASGSKQREEKVSLNLKKNPKN